nr:MAG TPA: hypothetical protein [Caudoviricetes sp.]
MVSLSLFTSTLRRRSGISLVNSSVQSSSLTQRRRTIRTVVIPL